MLNFFIGFAFFEFGALCGFFVAALMQAARDGGEIAGRNRTKDMRLSLQPTRTGNTFIITLSTTPLRWTAPGNSGIFYCPGWLCNG